VGDEQTPELPRRSDGTGVEVQALWSTFVSLRQALSRFVPTSFSDDERRRATLLLQLTVVFVGLSEAVALAITFYFGRLRTGLGVAAVAVPLALLPALLRRTRSLPLAVSVLNGLVYCALVAATATTGGVAQPSLSWLVLLPLTAVAIAGLRVGLGWALIAVLTPPMMLALERLGALPLSPVPPQLLGPAGAVNWVVLTIALVALGALAERLRLEAMREREAAHRELTASREGQVLTDRLAAMGTLAAGVAHELNNPLAAIAASARYLLEEARERSWGSDAQSAAADVAEAADRATGIIRDLREFTRPATDERPLSRLDAAWGSAVRLLRPALRERAELLAELPEDLPALRLQPSRLVQVLLNLLTNAVQAVSLNGGGRVRLAAARVDGFVELTLTDTGSGMSPEALRRAFDPFFTTRAVGDGVGLGLFVAHEIITRAGGSIELRSVSGEGSTVRCRIPIAG
jgi:signal transduction histidine kinase